MQSEGGFVGVLLPYSLVQEACYHPSCDGASGSILGEPRAILDCKEIPTQYGKEYVLLASPPLLEAISKPFNFSEASFFFLYSNQMK